MFIILGIFVGLGVIAWQFLNFLKWGEWPSRSIWAAVVYVLPPDEFRDWWIYHPGSWVGLHKVFTWFLDLPLWLGPILVGLLLDWWITSARKRSQSVSE